MYGNSGYFWPEVNENEMSEYDLNILSFIKHSNIVILKNCNENPRILKKYHPESGDFLHKLNS